MRKRILDFSQYSSLRIGGESSVQVLENLDDIAQVIDSKAYFHIIGQAYNLLISPNAKNLFMLDRSFDFIVDCGDYIEVGAMTPSGKIYEFFKRNDLCGLEFLRSLPGSAGGLTKMNAGMKEYEIKDVILGAVINGIYSENIGLSYRQSKIEGIISSVFLRKQKGFRFELLKSFKQMRASHPKLPSCGSCFKNPDGDYSGRLLESVGLKGFRYGGVGFSENHANFLVNYGGGTFDEAVYAIKLAQESVQKNFGITLQTEVQIIS